MRRRPPVIAVVALLVLAALLRGCSGSPQVTTPPTDTLNTMAPDTGGPATRAVGTP